MEGPMQYRNLGRTGVKVSELCLGTMLFGGKTEEQDAFRIVDRSMEAGLNFMDCANIYMGGESENVLGKALKRDNRRDRIVLATKVHGNVREDDPNGHGNHRRHIIEQCNLSLQRLQTDWIDLYQIHRPVSDTAIDETLRALDDLIRQGKVRYIGTSTYAAWQVVESLWASKELGLNRFVCEQPPYHLLDRRAERELLPMARTHGIGIIPWSPLAGGFLSGKYERDKDAPEGSRLEKSGREYDSRAFDVAEKVEEIAAEKGCTATALSLKWCADQPGVTSPIIGPRTMEQLEENLSAVDVEITDEDRKRLDEVAPPGRAIVPYYEADFGPHQYSW